MTDAIRIAEPIIAALSAQLKKDRAEIDERLNLFAGNEELETLALMLREEIDANRVALLANLPGMVRDALDDRGEKLFDEERQHTRNARVRLDELKLELDKRYFQLERRLLDELDRVAKITQPKDGEKGEKGDPGVNGRDGLDGIHGKDGRDGIDGKDGMDGINGKDGKDGLNGRDGVDGVPGQDGKDGKDGEKGAPGAYGKDGIDGINGKDGMDGAPGRDGRDGEKGEKGDRGEKGEPGRNGADGISLTPMGLFDDAKAYRPGDIVALGGGSWCAKRRTNPGEEPGNEANPENPAWMAFSQRGGKGKPGTDGKPGEKGDPGPRGEPGPIGPRGPGIAAAAFDGFTLRLVNSDGEEVAAVPFDALRKELDEIWKRLDA